MLVKHQYKVPVSIMHVSYYARDPGNKSVVANTQNTDILAQISMSCTDIMNEYLNNLNTPANLNIK